MGTKECRHCKQPIHQDARRCQHCQGMQSWIVIPPSMSTSGMRTSATIRESPIAKCDVHHRIYINTRTGLRACIDAAPGTRSAVYEFWPSDLLAIFHQSDITRRVPPPYEPGCSMEQISTKGAGPQITSPREGVVYSLRAASLKDERIPLTAVTDADTRIVHWFANEEYLGYSGSGKTFFWTPRPGKFALRAVDDQGRSTVRDVVTRIVE